MTTRSIARALVFCMTACLALASAGSRQAKASGIDTFNPGLPPQGAIGGYAAYMTPAQVHADYSGMGLTIILSEVSHSAFANIQLEQNATGPGGTGEKETFDSVLSGLVSINGTTNTPFTLTGAVEVIAYNRTSDSETGMFITQMLSMDMTGNVAGHSVAITLDPTMSTLGMTTITTESGPGAFHINSFFDVFTDISLDGGPPITTNGVGTTVILGTVPEPSALVMGGIAAAAGLAYAGWRRRRAT